MILILALSSTANATIYRWTDSAGVAYYTNKDYEIPPRYRAKAKILYEELANTAATQQNTTPPQQVKVDIKQPAVTPQTAFVEDKVLEAASLRRKRYMEGLKKSKSKPRKGHKPESNEE
jgi:hypothetical protein